MSLLSGLQQVQAECRRMEVLGWLLKCLQALAHSLHQSRDRLLDMTVDACEATWGKVYAATLRYETPHMGFCELFPQNVHLFRQSPLLCPIIESIST